MKKFKLFIIGIFCFLLPGCSGNSVEYYSDNKQKVDFRTFFKGQVEGWGAIFDFAGRQTRSFKVKLKGKWNKNEGVLEEWFEFDDGEKMTRKWDISFLDDHVFKATAGDIVGTAHGIQNGNAINTHYVLQIPYKNTSIDMSMDDWMYLIDDRAILNRTAMKKFGFKVGEIIIFLKR